MGENRHECLHNHDKKMTAAHDFDAHYSQRCGFGCGYSQSDMIRELYLELKEAREILASIKLENLDDKTQIRYIEAQKKWISKTTKKTFNYLKKYKDF